MLGMNDAYTLISCAHGVRQVELYLVFTLTQAQMR